jgi:DNA-binding transcriptional MerR regulator
VNRTYQPHEFAKRAGVTIRALHHYDRLGLLKPSGRTAAGYRLYTDRDLVRLEQIVALKFIGFPLSQIREVLNRKDVDVTAMLRQQRRSSPRSGTILTARFVPSSAPSRLCLQQNKPIGNLSGKSSR